MRRKKAFAILSIITLTFTGCAITIKPDFISIPHADIPPVVRLGEITETVTGTWKVYPSAGFRKNLVKILSESAPASRFSNNLSNVILSLHLVSDHEDDGPRLAALGMLSMATLGVIPLRYYSEWDVGCEAKFRRSDGTLINSYGLSEIGTYKIWVFPLTMFSLFGAGIRGNSDGEKMQNNVANNLADKITNIIDENYNEFARYAGKSTIQTAPHKTQTAPSVLVT